MGDFLKSFDNLQVTHTRSPILEETHYYPFGLTMSGISSKAASSLTNRYKFNGIEQENDFDLNYFEAFYRTIDPQIGRFLQVDPVTTHDESPYVMMGNNPVKNIDWLGNYFTWGEGNSQDTYNKLRAENCKRLEGYMNELAGMDLTSSDKGVQKKIGQLTKLINSHAELNNQWNEMEASDVEFHVSSEAPQKGAGGDTQYSMDNQRVDIRLGKYDKDLGTMAHEFRHAYGYLNGEMFGGHGGGYNMMDEVSAYNVGYLFSFIDVALDVVDGKYDLQWCKDNKLNSPLYESLVGKEVQITTNTTAAIYLKYFDPKSDRIAHMMNINKNNTNYTVQNAIDDLNAHASKTGREPEFRSGDLLKNR